MPLPRYIFHLPPEDIIKYFEAKHPQITWNWDDLWQDAHLSAFTVAKAAKLDILKSIQDEITDAMKTGITEREFKKRMEPTLKSLGWWGKVKASDVPGYDPESGVDPDKVVQLGSPWRLHTIFHQNMETHYSRKRWQQQQKAVATHPYIQYIAILDKNTRPEHAKLNDLVFRYDDPFWNYFYPPNDWGCRCYTRNLSEADLNRLDLKVEQTGPHNFGTEQFIDKKGRTRTRAWFGQQNQRLYTGNGFAYNPGTELWQPDLNEYDPQLVAFYNQDQQPPVSGLHSLL